MKRDMRPWLGFVAVCLSFGAAVGILRPIESLELALGVGLLLISMTTAWSGLVVGALLSANLLLASGSLGFAVPSGTREVLLAIWLLGSLVRGRTRPSRPTPAWFWMAALVTWSLLILAIHGADLISVQSMVLNLELPAALLTCVMFGDSESPRRLLLGLCVGVLAVLVLSALGFTYARSDSNGVTLNTVLWDSVGIGARVIRQTWGFGEPNNAGLTLAMAAISTLAVDLKRKWANRAAAVGSLVFLVGALATFSRTAILLLVICALYAMLAVRPRGGSAFLRVTVALSTGAAALAAIAAMVPVLWIRVASMVNPAHPANAGRLSLLRELGAGVLGAPVFGHGWGSLGALVPWWGYGVHVADDHYLQYAFQLGLPGLVLFVGLLAAVLRDALQSGASHAQSLRSSLLVGALIGYCAGGLFANSWEMLPAAVLFWAVVAVLLSGGRRVEGTTV